MTDEEEVAFVEHMFECDHCDALADEIRERRISYKLMKFEERVDKLASEHKDQDIGTLNVAKELRAFADEYGLHDLIKKISPTMKAALLAPIDQVKDKYNELLAAFDNKDWQEVIRLGSEMEALGYDENVHPIKEKVEHAKEQLLNVPIKVVVDDKEIFQNKVSEKKIIAIYPIVKVLIERGTDKLKELIIKDNMILGLPDQDETGSKILYEDELIKIEFIEAEHEGRLVFTPKK